MASWIWWDMSPERLIIYFTFIICISNVWALKTGKNYTSYTQIITEFYLIFNAKINKPEYTYLLTPSPEQDVTQSQF